MSFHQKITCSLWVMKDTVEKVAAALSLFYFYHYECGKGSPRSNRGLIFCCTSAQIFNNNKINHKNVFVFFCCFFFITSSETFKLTLIGNWTSLDVFILKFGNVLFKMTLTHFSKLCWAQSKNLKEFFFWSWTRLY